MSEKATFTTKLGMLAATVGSAIGLGNVWRFPAEAQTNGGGAFLLVYIACVFILGIPVMLAETSLGRAGGSDSVGNFKNLTPKSRWWVAGTIGLLASFIILSFYMVVAGWTLEYLFNTLSGDLFGGFKAVSEEADKVYFTQKMDEYISSTWSPLIWTYIMLGLNLVVLIKGVSKGIEKVSNLLMPLLFVLMIVFCYFSLSLPNAQEGVKFFLYPDFSKINIDTVLNALGQAFFSLSLGMGVLVTYSAYYPKNTRLTQTAVTVSLLDFLMAFLMGLVIFPAVKSLGITATTGNLEGTTLVFVTLPDIFANMQGTVIWSALFFLLLAVAAITSTISIAEVSVAFIHDRFGVKRTWACVMVIGALAVTGTLSSLSLGAAPGLSVAGMPIFDFFDTFGSNVLLPLSALGICLYVGWVLPRDFIRNELSNYGRIPAASAPLVAALVRYICPLLIAAILISKLVSML